MKTEQRVLNCPKDPNGSLEKAIKSIEQVKHQFGEFDPGSGRTLAACLIHASRADLIESLLSIKLAADG